MQFSALRPTKSDLYTGKWKRDLGFLSQAIVIGSSSKPLNIPY